MCLVHFIINTVFVYLEVACRETIASPTTLNLSQRMYVCTCTYNYNDKCVYVATCMYITSFIQII